MPGAGGYRDGGRPEEYFLAEDPVRLPGWGFWEDGPHGAAEGVTSREANLDAVYRLGSTANGVFGAKLMWNNLRWAVARFQEMPCPAPSQRSLPVVSSTTTT